MSQRRTIEVRDKIATYVSNEPIVCGNADYVIDFVFDAEWDAHEIKTALFVVNGKSTPQVFAGNVCPVPVLQNTLIAKVGVFAGTIDDGTLSTTTSAFVRCAPCITDGDNIPIPPPTDDVYNRIIEQIESGMLKGNKGDKGDTGDRGDKGDKGDTGAPFTYADFTSEQLAKLKGEKGDKGDKGDTGENGKPFTYEDFTPEQLYWLKGEKGDKGDKGDQGIQGEKGEKGEPFTYADFTEEQLAKLKGENGMDGQNGYTPVKGVDYWTTEDVAEIDEHIQGEIAERMNNLPKPVRVVDVQSLLDTNDIEEFHNCIEAITNGDCIPLIFYEDAYFTPLVILDDEIRWMYHGADEFILNYLGVRDDELIRWDEYCDLSNVNHIPVDMYGEVLRGDNVEGEITLDIGFQSSSGDDVFGTNIVLPNPMKILDLRELLDNDDVTTFRNECFMCSEGYYSLYGRYYGTIYPLSVWFDENFSQVQLMAMDADQFTLVSICQDGEHLERYSIAFDHSNIADKDYVDNLPDYLSPTITEAQQEKWRNMIGVKTGIVLDVQEIIDNQDHTAIIEACELGDSGEQVVSVKYDGCVYPAIINNCPENDIYEIIWVLYKSDGSRGWYILSCVDGEVSFTEVIEPVGITLYEHRVEIKPHYYGEEYEERIPLIFIDSDPSRVSDDVWTLCHRLAKAVKAYFHVGNGYHYLNVIGADAENNEIIVIDSFQAVQTSLLIEEVYID